jgi:hypothetical protein
MQSNTLRSIESILTDEQPSALYLLVICREWAPWRLHELPAPLAQWFAHHHPGIAVEEVRWQDDFRLIFDCEAPDLADTSDWPRPIFRVGFGSQAEADAFAEVWQTDPALQPPAGLENFSMVSIEPNAVLLANLAQ